MNILFAGTTICTAKGTDSPQNFSYTGERSEQVSRFLRGRQAVVRDRGNEYTQIAFTITRSHGTVQAAEYFCLTHRINLPTYGVLKLVTSDGSGGATKALTLNNALAKSIKTRYEGMLSFTDYTFSGGAVTIAVAS